MLRGGDNKITNLNQTLAGSLITTNSRPIIQGNCTYGFIPSNFRQYTTTGGSTGVESRMFKTSTGTSAGGYGAIQSFRSLNFKNGETAEIRFTGLFDSSAASSWQGIGFIALGDELSFGYNGTDFGIWYRYGGLAEIRVVTVTGGRLLAALSVPAGGVNDVDLQKLDIQIPPGLHLIVQARQASGGSAANITAALIWYEDI